MASLLGQATSHKTEQHEPFNPDRNHGSIVQEWNHDFDVNAMRGKVSRVLDGTPVIKHCYEVVPMQLNILLLEQALRRDYKQIVLRRRNEVDRVFSLELAALTGAWGPEQARQVFDDIRSNRRPKPVLPIKKSISHMSDCHLRSTWLLAALRSLKVNYYEIFYEDLFFDPLIGIQIANGVLSHLEHSEKKIADLENSINRALSERGQDSKQIAGAVGNNANWRKAMQGAWEVLQAIDTCP